MTLYISFYWLKIPTCSGKNVHFLTCFGRPVKMRMVVGFVRRRSSWSSPVAVQGQTQAWGRGSACRSA